MKCPAKRPGRALINQESVLKLYLGKNRKETRFDLAEGVKR